MACYRSQQAMEQNIGHKAWSKNVFENEKIKRFELTMQIVLKEKIIKLKVISKSDFFFLPQLLTLCWQRGGASDYRAWNNAEHWLDKIFSSVAFRNFGNWKCL